MKLYLSSFGLGCAADRWVRMVGAGRPVGVVLHAIDDRDATARELAWQREADLLRSLGLRPYQLDLYQPDGLERAEAAWVRGGNTFLLRAALAVTGADAVLTRRIRSGELAYGGYSAGCTVLGTDLSVVASVDPPSVVRPALLRDHPVPAPAVINIGLGLLDRPLIPHVGSPGHPETAACTAISADLEARGVDHLALRDGDVWIADGRGARLLRADRNP